MRKLSLPNTLHELRHVHNPGYDVLNPKPTYGKKAAVAQFLATVVQSLMLVNVGMEMAMSTIVIGSLFKNPNAEFELSESESSWYGSILFMCQPIGSLLAGYTQKHYGKKSCIVLACVPSIIGWIMLWSANSVTMLYASTVTMGLGLGFSDGPVYSYIGEICEPRLRGIMSCIVNMACLIGVMSSYGLGFVFPWRTVALLSLICPVLCLLLSVFIPESPIWLLSQNKTEEALKAICWLRGWVDRLVVVNEYQELIHYYKTSVEQTKIHKNWTGILSSLAWLKDPSVYRPLRLATLYYMVTLISCLTPIRPYIVQLMDQAGVNNTHSIALILFGAMQLAGSVGLPLTIRKFGKRKLTLMTLSVNLLAIFLFGAYVMCFRDGLIAARNYVPLTLYSVISFSSAMGILTIPWTLVSEIYPNEAKGFASSLTTAIFYTLTFVTTKVYLSIENAMGLSNTFYTFTVFGFVGFVYLYRNMPETENKTFLEIEEFFVPKNNQTRIESQQPAP